ncbi:MAG: hypothetical protein EXS05_11785 [Planctomycetaceae bacterium]|nr:hypothetical protein [Planctomycetaceae bacterium]
MNERLPQHNRADCRAARRVLEWARPGETEALPLAASNRHVESCPDCRAALERNRQLDLKIGRLCRDVPLPADLQSRLLAALQIPSDAAATDRVSKDGPMSVEVAAASVKHGPQNRLWLRHSVLAAACVFVVLGAWFVIRPPRPTLNLDELTAQVIELVDPQALPEFAVGDVPPPPRSMDTRFLRIPPKRLPGDSAALYCFRFKTPRGRIIEGRLLAVPVAQLKNAPTSSSFLGRPAVYLAQGFCSSQWAEGGYAYVCLLKGGESDLNRLLPASSVAM